MTSINLQTFLSRRRVLAVIAVVCALVATSCANLDQGGATAASPDASPTSVSPDTAVTSSSQPGQSPSPAVDRDFADLVADYVYENRDAFAGAGWIGEDNSTLAIWVASGREDSPEVAWLRRQVPDPSRGGDKVEFITVTHSSSTLDHIIELLTPRQLDRHIDGLGLDVVHNRVWVGASPEQIEAAGGEEALLDLLYSDLPDEFQDVLFLEEVEMPTTEELPPDDVDAIGPLSGHRRADTRPFNGGAGYRWQNNASRCSLKCSDRDRRLSLHGDCWTLSEQREGARGVPPI